MWDYVLIALGSIGLSIIGALTRIFYTKDIRKIKFQEYMQNILGCVFVSVLATLAAWHYTWPAALSIAGSGLLGFAGVPFLAKLLNDYLDKKNLPTVEIKGITDVKENKK